jgi:hypothetical protein
MKKILTLLVMLITGTSFLIAQDAPQVPVVMKPVYFDLSPPLRDMVQKSDPVADLSWKAGIVKNKKNVSSNEEAGQDNLFSDEVVQAMLGDAMTDTTIQNFDGIGSTGYYPPDTDGDVGPSHYFQVVNCKYAIYNKNGVKILGPNNNSNIFSGLPNNSNDGDAIVLYDENADRWLFSQFSLPNYPNGPFYENVAISQTGDPTGSWYRYQFQFADMPDYPKLSVWADGYYMTIRRFASGSGNWLGPAAVAMDRASMLAGSPTASMVMFNLPSSSEGPLPADCDSEFPAAGTPCPVCYLTNSSVKVYDFHVDWANTANSTFLNTVTVPIATFSNFGSSNYISQKGTTQKLDAFSRKVTMFRMPYRKFNAHSSMLLNTTVNVNSVAAIRWMELRYINNTWSLYQEGTYAPGDGHHRWMGSIAMDSAGNIALGFSISSTNMFPSIRYTGRLSGDPLGVMTIAESGIINGGGSQTNVDGRWGDYSALVADPSEVGKFWYTTEYYSSTSNSNWKTRIASFSFGNIFSAVASSNPPLVCQGDSSQLSVVANGGSGIYSYSWTSIPAGFTSTLQNPKVAPEDTTKYIVTTTDGTLTRTDTTYVNVQHLPVVTAGNDTIVCWYVTSVDLQGTITPNYKAIGWVTEGTGSFTNASALTTQYLPTLNDKLAGSVVLKLIAIPNLPCTGNVISTKTVVFDQCTGLTEPVKGETSLTVQPNPARNIVHIILTELGKEASALTITTPEGKAVYSEEIAGGTGSLDRSLDVSKFSKGFYLVNLRAGKEVKTAKLIVQ